ncbi:MAG: AEC family transporter [Deltaproteobacteria bacterium]|nr:AEC family transporter [Deltaproteobacteria bacterium]
MLKQAIGSVLTLLLIGSVGFYIDRKGWVNQQVKDFIPVFVIGATLPFYLFINTVEAVKREDLLGLFKGSFAVMISMVVVFTVSILVYRLGKVKKTRRGIFCVSFTFSNTMFIGLPVNMALFGEAALANVIAYFIANSFFFWTLGNYIMSLDVPGKTVSILSWGTLKRIFPPPLFGFFIGVLVIIFEIPVPVFIKAASSSIGNLTTPLAIIYIALNLTSMDFRSFGFEKDISLALLGRFLICPIITLVICSAFTLPTLMRQVFMIQSSLPVLVSCSILAGYYRSDLSYAVLLVSISTLMTIVTVPIFRILAIFL